MFNCGNSHFDMQIKVSVIYLEAHSYKPKRGSKDLFSHPERGQVRNSLRVKTNAIKT